MAYRRSQYLILPKFQLKFSLYVVSWIFGLSLVYPFIIHYLFNMVLSLAANDPMASGLNQLGKARENVLWMLVGLQAFFLLVTFLITVFVSHRIAGPLFKLMRTFRTAKTGDLKTELSFRKTDHFHDVAVEYNQMMDSIRLAFRQNSDAATEIIDRLEKALPHTEASARIQLEKSIGLLRNVKDRALLP